MKPPATYDCRCVRFMLGDVELKPQDVRVLSWSLEPQAKACECGSTACGSEAHSNWCPLFEAGIG